MIRSPSRVAAAVAAAVVAVTAVLAVLAGQVNARAERDLLQREVAQAGAVLTTQIAVLTTQLADAAQVATGTDPGTGGDPGAFEDFAAARVTGAGDRSLSLWRTGGDGQAERLAAEGPDQAGPDGAGFAALLARVPADGTLTVTGILPGEPARLGYALRPAGDTAGLVVYAEVVLPPGRRIQVPPGEAFSGLDFAVHLGRETTTEQLLYSTGPVPVGGDTARATVPFGDTVITVVASSPASLTGTLSSALPWIVAGVGLVLAGAAAVAVAAVLRRRGQAERLAAENERLYRQQRGIAATLQHALLPEVPTLDGVEVAARYVAGGDGLEVGGDWYDVIARGPGCCVFVVGDISGSGLSAATTMAQLRFAVRAFLAQGHDITVVLAELRRLLDVDTDHRFATVLLGELDTGSGRLRLVCAGHFPPLLVADGGAGYVPVRLTAPVGVDVSGAPPAVEVRLPDSGTLLAFTDGLIERRGEVIDTGLDRLRAAAAARDLQPLPRVLDELMEALDVEGGGDDTVLLGMRWTR